MTEVGNGLLSCPTSASGCADARAGQGTKLDDDDWAMVPFNQSGENTTKSSSATQLDLPAGATVRWAGLYWSGGLINGTKQETIKLRGPGQTDYTVDQPPRAPTSAPRTPGRCSSRTPT